MPTTPIAGHDPSRGAPWRAVAATLLITVAVLASLPALVAHQVHQLIHDTDHYVATVAPLAKDPLVRESVADRLSDALIDRIDLQGLGDGALDKLDGLGMPDAVGDVLGNLTGPVAGGAEALIRRTVETVIASPAFATAWSHANRAAHDQFAAMITGDPDALLTASGNRVVLDLAAVVEDAKNALADRGLVVVRLIPSFSLEYTLVESPNVSRLQRAVRALDATATVLPWIVVVGLCGGIVLARDRRRAIVGAALGFAVAMLLFRPILRLVVDQLIVSDPGDWASQPVTAALFDAITDPLRAWTGSIAAVALVVAAAAWIAGRVRAFEAQN